MFLIVIQRLLGFEFEWRVRRNISRPTRLVLDIEPDAPKSLNRRPALHLDVMKRIRSLRVDTCVFCRIVQAQGRVTCYTSGEV